MPIMTVKDGDTILIDFTLRLENGTIVGTTLDSDPAEIVIGQGDVINGIEKAVIGMQEGEQQTISIESIDAFGPYNDNLIQEIDRSCVPEAAKLISGQIIELYNDTQEPISATILEINSKSIKVDANHQLAGKNIIVDLKVIEILKSKV
ncbi:MAG TPA: peptidylprolyl isomerase [Chitinispirillaceae bacterium]|nr:peptidylprolyl isomerase [Chitinispirillaceae bacterium]